MRYLSEISWRHSYDVCTQVPNNYEFLVWLSVFWMRSLSEFFWRHSWFDFYTCSKEIWICCMSVILLFGLLPYWNYTNLDNSSSGWDIFLIFCADFPWHIWHLSDNFWFTFCSLEGQLLRPSGLVFWYFDFKGPKYWKIYPWNSRTMTSSNLRPLAIKLSEEKFFGQNSLQIYLRILSDLHTELHFKSDHKTGENDQYQKI